MSYLKSRFWAKVKKTKGCWIWTGATRGHPKGAYGTITVNKKCIRTNRMAWILSYGPIPPGMKVLHKCHNSICVRPGHLKLGTTSENSYDMIQSGRFGFGEKHGRAKLTEKQARLTKEGKLPWSVRETARRWGVCRATLGHIRAGRNWRHL